MALDPSIVQRFSNRQGLGSELMQGYDANVDRQNRLAQLAKQQDVQAQQQANQQEMQGYQLRGLQRAEAAIPAQQAASQQEASKKHQQELNLGAAQQLRQGATPEQVVQWGVKESQARGIDPALTQQHLTQVFQSGKPVEEIASAFEMAAYPEQAAKQRFEQMFAKPKAEDVLGERKLGLQEKELSWKMAQKPATPLEPPPKSPPGTRVYQEGGEWKSEVIKGTPQYQALKSKEAPDRALVQNVVPQFEKNVTDIDKLVNSKGFEKIFGLVGGVTPNISKEAREAAQLRAQVVGAMETSGMQLQRAAGGAVGSMTVQEWPKMQSYLSVIQNSNDPKAVKDALVGAQAVYDRMATVAKEGYMNEWGSGQFGDPNVITRLEKNKPKQHVAPTSNIDSLLDKYK